MRAGLAVLAVGVLAAAGTGPASADEVWHQGYERPSADARCVAPADQTPWQDTFTGHQDWRPSWAEWANGGRGGWVCQRTIVWARSAPSAPPYPSAGCVLADNEPTYVDFRGGWSLSASPVVQGYDDPACTGLGDQLTVDLVYAPSGYDPVALCLEAFGSAAFLPSWRDVGSGVYGCVVHIPER